MSEANAERALPVGKNRGLNKRHETVVENFKARHAKLYRMYEDAHRFTAHLNTYFTKTVNTSEEELRTLGMTANTNTTTTTTEHNPVGKDGQLCGTASAGGGGSGSAYGGAGGSGSASGDAGGRGSAYGGAGGSGSSSGGAGGQ